MKIKIKDNAARVYTSRFRGAAVPDYRWTQVLRAIQGMTIEVETEFLFKNQFNTVSIPGISENGLRIMEESVEYVIDDERPGKARCQWCGTTTPSGEPCKKCGKTEYLEDLWCKETAEEFYKRRGYDMYGKPV